MALSTYAELKASVLNDLLRASDPDAGSRFNDWLVKFEAHARRELSGSNLGELVSDNSAIDSEYTALPSSLMSIRAASVTVNGIRRPLAALTPYGIEEQFGDQTGAPIGYCIVGSSIRIAPPPDASYTVRIVYTSLVALTSTATSNWLLAAAPDLYENGCLWQAQRYYKNFDEVDRLFGECKAAIAGLVKQSKLNLPTAGMAPRINAGIA